MTTEIRIDNVSKVFGNFQCLRNVNLTIRPGELMVFLGPSGCGKTTLMRMIAGFETPTTGKLSMNGAELREPGSDRGLIFQEGVNFGWRTLIRNVEFGLELKGLPKSERSKRAEEYLDLVGLAGFKGYYPSEISGGMKQKMALATVLVNDPEVLLMDEPFGALDAQTRTLMQRELLRIWAKAKKTVIFVTHSIREALVIGSRICLFKTRPGEIVEILDLDEMFRKRNVDRQPSDPELVELETAIYRRMRQDED
jgi:ABC-type nitrate/sulfonate/bicarbonate transport system ATPase subunit